MQEKGSCMNYIDLFAGCGGLSEGFESAGDYQGLAHVEWEFPMVKTLRNRLEKNNGYSEDEALKRVVYFDIQETEQLVHGCTTKEKFYRNNHEQFKRRGLKGIIGDNEIDLVIGGPPCQAYSIAGRAQDKNSMKDDYRNYLFESFAAVVNKFQPKLFVFENVQGILSATPGDIPVLQRIYEAFAEIGYLIRSPKDQKNSLFNANDFGVPQNRKRVIIIGVRENLNLSLESIYEAIEKQKIDLKPTLRDAIGDLPKFQPLQVPTKNRSHEFMDDQYLKNHVPRFHNKRDIGIFKEWIQQDMNKRSLGEKLDFYYRKTGKSSNHNKYRSLNWDKPSPTIVSHLQKDGLLFIHPDAEQARSLTVREAALIQSFPTNFEFLGSQGYQYKMIGNAVPPLLANRIALALKEFL